MPAPHSSQEGPGLGALMAAKKRKSKSRSGRSLTSAERLALGQAKLQVHLPAELLRDVDTLAWLTGSSRTAVVRAALEEHLSRVVR